MHAQEIESKLEAKFTRWRDWRLYQQQVPLPPSLPPSSSPLAVTWSKGESDITCGPGVGGEGRGRLKEAEVD